MLSEGLTQILIPVTAFIGIGFALLQWLLVSRVRVSSADHTEADNGYRKSLMGDSELENGVQSVEVTNKCTEIQHAISVGERCLVLSYEFMIGFSYDRCKLKLNFFLKCSQELLHFCLPSIST